MARLLDDALLETLSKNVAVVFGTPLTASAWFRSDDDTIAQSLLSIGDKDVGDNFFNLFINSDNTVRAQTRDAGGIEAAITSTTYTVNTWNHAAGVWVSPTDRNALLNGAGKGSAVMSITPVGLDRTVIGSTADSSPAQFCSGRVCEVVVWNVALTDFEITLLALGVNPRLIRPANIVGYWPVWGRHSPEIDLSGNGNSLTLSGTTPANHAPVSLFTPKWAASVPLIEVAAAGLPPYGQVIFNSADQENRPRYGQRIARGTEE